MSKSAHRIDQFMNGPVDAPTTGAIWSKRQRPGRADAAIARKYEALLNDLAVTEEFHGYPGLQLMAALKEARGRRCRDVAGAGDPDYAGADDAIVPPARR